MIRNRELQCLLDEKKTDGIHIGFVYTPPEVYAMLKKKEGIIKSRPQQQQAKTYSYDKGRKKRKTVAAIPPIGSLAYLLSQR